MKARGLLFLVLVWLALLALFSWRAGPAFAGLEGLETIARQTAIVGFCTLGMTFVLISGMVDLSVGSLVALVSVATAWLLRSGMAAEKAALCGVLVGAAAGVLNGQIVTRLKVSPFIATLGTLLALRGIATGLADEKKIDAPMTFLDSMMAKLPPAHKGQLLPTGVWLLIGAAIIAAVVLERTVFGRNAVAVGANPDASRLAGVSPDTVRRQVFVLSGLFAGIAGVMQMGRLTQGDPTVAGGLELQVIAAAVIGGASLSGGQGSVEGSLMGALLMATIASGCSQTGIPNWVQNIVTGTIIVGALALDRFRRGPSGALA